MCACVHGGGAEDESISSRPRVECRTDVGFDSTTLRSWPEYKSRARCSNAWAPRHPYAYHLTSFPITSLLTAAARTPGLSLATNGTFLPPTSSSLSQVSGYVAQSLISLGLFWNVTGSDKPITLRLLKSVLCFPHTLKTDGHYIIHLFVYLFISDFPIWLSAPGSHGLVDPVDLVTGTVPGT